MPSALIAEDEPSIAADLAARLKALWAEIEIVAICPDGIAAALEIERLAPDVAFVDVRMPGMDGLEVARAADKTRIVFVTAYDEHAIDAFEANAVDYLLKPVSDARLARCVLRLQRNYTGATPPPVRLDAAPRASPMSWFTVEDGAGRRLVHLQDVTYLRAQDKYTVVVTRDGRYVVRASLKDLLTRLDPGTFVQIHRSTILNINAVDRLEAEVFGRMRVRLKNCPDVLTVSRSFCDRFRPI